MLSRYAANLAPASTNKGNKGGDVLERIFEKLEEQKTVLHRLEEQKTVLHRLDRSVSELVEDRVREIAGRSFLLGEEASKFVANCLSDIIDLASPHGLLFRQQQDLEEKLADFVSHHYVDFVQAYYQHLKSVIINSSLLMAHPWVVDGSVNPANIKACSRDLTPSQRRIQKRIAMAAKESAKGQDSKLMSTLKSSSGPGLSIFLWCACGEFIDCLELDCRGKVELSGPKNAIIMGAEVKTSSSAIPAAKKQLRRRFRIIAKCLEVVRGITRKNCIFVGRVLYRTVPTNMIVVESEFEEGEPEFENVSFFYHRI
eukprot:gene32119-38842_t